MLFVLMFVSNNHYVITVLDAGCFAPQCLRSQYLQNNNVLYYIIPLHVIKLTIKHFPTKLVLTALVRHYHTSYSGIPNPSFEFP